MRLFLGLTLASAIATTIPVSVSPPRTEIIGVGLARTVVVTGTIRDASTATPIAGVTVSFVGSGAAPVSSEATSALSNDMGRYHLRIRLDDTATVVVLTASRLGYVPGKVSGAAPKPGQDSANVDIALKPQTMGLEGVLSSATSDPTTGAKTPMAITKLDAQQMPVPNFTPGGLAISGKVAGVIKTVGVAPGSPRSPFNSEEYGKVEENVFVSARDVPLSTFSADVDRASYSIVRRFIRDGQLPPKDVVRIEELINYFHYDIAPPRGTDPVAVVTEIAPAPWNRAHQIMRVALQTAPIETAKLPPNNLVFLIDVSGSMSTPERLPLAKAGFRMLVEQLREQDRVAIVTYAGEAGVALPSTPGSDKEKILNAIDRLEAGGSTAGGAGLQLAYDVASRNFIRDGNNRVILATDGDFNVGISNTADLVRFIEGRRGEGIALTALGFGMGNYKDNRIAQLADHGNGNYAYIDDLAEAGKVFVHEMGATLVTVAKDVKLQVEFNPSAVQAYRLIGYESRLLRARDFTDDQKDAGEIGAGHSVTALYEIVPVGVALDVDIGSIPPLRYADSMHTMMPTVRRREVANVSVRYQLPSSDTSRLLQHPVTNGTAAPSNDMRFAMAVAGYGMLLRNSLLRGSFSYEDVLVLGRSALGTDQEKYRADFVELVRATRSFIPADGRR